MGTAALREVSTVIIADIEQAWEEPALSHMGLQVFLHRVGLQDPSPGKLLPSRHLTDEKEKEELAENKHLPVKLLAPPNSANDGLRSNLRAFVMN